MAENNTSPANETQGEKKKHKYAVIGIEPPGRVYFQGVYLNLSDMPQYKLKALYKKGLTQYIKLTIS